MNKTTDAQTTRVLLVEDSTLLRSRIRSLIEEAGPVVVVGEAGTVADSLALFRKHRPGAVVLDLRLPDGDGSTVLTEIKRAHPECVVIVLTNFAETEARRLCLQAGADHFLDKSRDFERVPELLVGLARSKTRSRTP